jgi:hypothetical protein
MQKVTVPFNREKEVEGVGRGVEVRTSVKMKLSLKVFQ